MGNPIMRPSRHPKSRPTFLNLLNCHPGRGITQPILDLSAEDCTTVWGGRLRKRFCNMFSESSTGSWAELQLPCCPSKQGELPKIYNKTFYTPCRPRLATLCTISDLFSIAHHSNTRRRSQAKRVSTQVTLFMRLVALKYKENGKKSARLV